MRGATNKALILTFMERLGREATAHSDVFFTGGATAVLQGWRKTTVDVDIKIIPESDQVLRALPRLKEELDMNIELACPSDFIPELPGWRERSSFIDACGKLSYRHYDFYAQALSKIERGHQQDRRDVREMIRRKLVSPPKLLDLFRQIENKLFRYPAIDPTTFRRSVDALTTPKRTRNSRV